MQRGLFFGAVKPASRRTALALLLGALVGASLVVAAPSPVEAQTGGSRIAQAEQAIPGRYVVTLRDGPTIPNVDLVVGDLIGQHGGVLRQVVLDGPPCCSPDLDLYVRRAAKPTTATYACRPYESDSDETCTISAPAADWWYIGVRVYAGSSGSTYTIRATY